MRVINVWVPIYHKIIVDALSEESIQVEVLSLAGFCNTKLLVSEIMAMGGSLSMGYVKSVTRGRDRDWRLRKSQVGFSTQPLFTFACRTYLWIRVQQFTALEIQVGLFRHIHQLSLKWHMSRKTGEVLRVMDRGTSSINNLLQYLVFSIVPTFIDIGIAIIYFCVEFNYWCVEKEIQNVKHDFITQVRRHNIPYHGVLPHWNNHDYRVEDEIQVHYVSINICVVLLFRREMNLKENDQRTKGLDSLLNAETVKYFSMEDWETERYKNSIELYQVISDFSSGLKTH